MLASMMAAPLPVAASSSPRSESTPLVTEPSASVASGTTQAYVPASTTLPTVHLDDSSPAAAEETKARIAASSSTTRVSPAAAANANVIVGVGNLHFPGQTEVLQQIDGSTVYRVEDGTNVQKYLGSSGGPITATINLPFMGPSDLSTEAPLPGHLMFGKTAHLLLLAYDVDSDCGCAIPEQDTVYLNGVKLGLLNGVNDALKPTGFDISTSLLRFPTGKVGDLYHGANQILVSIDDNDPSPHWMVLIENIDLTLPSPNLKQSDEPVVLLHWLFCVNSNGSNEMNNS